MKKIVTIAVLAGASMLAACNTVHGAGKDVSSAAKAVTKAADKAK